jgi:hypothetical protein
MTWLACLEPQDSESAPGKRNCGGAPMRSEADDDRVPGLRPDNARHGRTLRVALRPAGRGSDA